VIFVLDASVTLCWLFGDGKPADRAYALKVLNAMKEARTGARVPATWGLEIANVLARAEARGIVTEVQSGAFLDLLAGIDIGADAETPARALSDTLDVARRYRLSAYDASYLELAIRERLSLATLDADLRDAASRAGVKRWD
jgi:predicted nucleic acid-binding protein